MRASGRNGVTFARPDGRTLTALRPITINVGVSKFAEGSAEISFGDTKVLCLASLRKACRSSSMARHRLDTAEYAMLPRSTRSAASAESIAGRPVATFEIRVWSVARSARRSI